MSIFLSISQDERFTDFARQVAQKLGQADFSSCLGGPAEAAKLISAHRIAPKFILIEIGDFYPSFFAELDELAQNCTAGTKVIIIGNVNDLTFYRELIKCGITEYFVKPANIDDVRNTFFANAAKPSAAAAAVQAKSEQDGKVISFLSSSSGDGATTIAINTAYTLAQKYAAPTVVIDMDYQFGLVARNLDVAFTTGLKDLYEQSSDSIDATFIEKAIVPYRNNMFIIPAPRELGVMPQVSPQTLISAIQILRKRFKYIIIDLPHLWSDWVALVLGEVDRHLMVSQLNLKSVTHASRLLDAFENNGVARSKISILINRSGSRLKEPFSPSEFALATKQKIDFYVSNDSKTIALSEDKGQTAIETGSGLLNKQFEELADAIVATQ